MEYTFSRNGIEEVVHLERWAWGVVYKDGTELHQFGDDGKFHQVGEIQPDEVKMFTMYRTDDMKKRIDLVCTNPVQYFHFYRNFILDDNTKRVRVYVFGWKNKENGACSYNYILPDDRVVTSDSDILDLSAFNL